MIILLKVELFANDKHFGFILNHDQSDANKMY